MLLLRLRFLLRSSSFRSRVSVSPASKLGTFLGGTYLPTLLVLGVAAEKEHTSLSCENTVSEGHPKTAQKIGLVSFFGALFDTLACRLCYKTAEMSF